MSRRFSTLLLLGIIGSAAPARACLWDYDTLRDEKRGMPGIAEVLAGQWERHSRFFYQHRVEQMKALLATQPRNWDARDNLAVAEEKLGDHDAAIAVMLSKEKASPGQYTTSSNLGTFYMFKGELEPAIAYIRKAMVVNPNAHFGREKYQLQLAEFLLEQKTTPAIEDEDFLKIGLRRGEDGRQFVTSSYRRAARSMADTGQWLVPSDAVQGIVGMIRFGTVQSPDLYFALGDVLALKGDKSLAYRAYLRAMECHPAHLESVQSAADEVGSGIASSDSVAAEVIASERNAADKWVRDYQAFEDDLIRSGKSTDEESNYKSFYATHGRKLATPDWFWSDFERTDYGFALCFAVLLVWYPVSIDRRKYRPARLAARAAQRAAALGAANSPSYAAMNASKAAGSAGAVRADS